MSIGGLFVEGCRYFSDIVYVIGRPCNGFVNGCKERLVEK